MPRILHVLGLTAMLMFAVVLDSDGQAGRSARPRVRDLGVAPGVFEPGAHNAITDVAGVGVGHFTLAEGPVQTGVTAIVGPAANPFRERMPAAMVIGNGFGKLIGYSQVSELGEIETPILLTNTLAVWDGAAALVDYILGLPGNEEVRSVNPVVGETNDGWLNAIRDRPLQKQHFLAALEDASGGPVREGSIGAGRGTRAFGFKGGIGTSSRVVPERSGGHVVGVLVQTNFGGILTIDGVPVGKRLGRHAFSERAGSGDGSCMIVVATDAPLDARQLRRLARRALAGMARTGASFSHGSGDYVIAFSVAEGVRIHVARSPSDSPRRRSVAEPRLSPLFQAVAEATEEAIYNSLLAAEAVEGRDGHRAEPIPLGRLRELLAAHRPG